MITSEKDLYFLWEEFCRQGRQTTDKRLSGIDAGQPNRFAGPDYQGAEFELDGKIYRGDVEIHVRAADWYAHHHHLDRRYTQVLLHLVWETDPDFSIRNSQDRPVTTLSLRSFPPIKRSKHIKDYCKWQNKKPADITNKLKALALQRLMAKHKQIGYLCSSMSFDQVLYLLLLRILGQPHNVDNFILLGNLLPWEVLTRIKERRQLTTTHWLALFAQQSGLIDRVPSFRHLKVLQNEIEALYNRSSLEDANLLWHLSGQRPRNSPVYHLRILACWFSHFLSHSLYYSLKEILCRRLPVREAIKALEDLFSSVPAVSSNTNLTPPPTWGKAKLTEIIGNIVLPFFHRESVCQDSTGFKAYLESLFFALPHTQYYSCLDHFYRLPGLKSRPTNRFFFNQGLLFLDEHYCQTSGCQFCPFEIKHKYIDKNFENI